MENKVVCIKPYKSILTVNKVYEVKREDDDTVIIVGNGSIRYVIPRAYFMEVKVIKKMRYTKESCAYIPNMKIGEVYEVVEETKDGFYIVINSKRMTARVPKNCFEDIERVVCVDNATNRYITVGKEYKMVEEEGLQDWLVLIKNDTGEVEMYPKRLFKPIEDKPTITTGGNIHITGEDSTITRDNGIWEDNIPKKVVCVNNVIINKIGNITRGNEYEVLGISPQDGVISIIDDFGDKATFHKSLFKPIQSPSRSISLNLTFDTSELQSKLEKALYHLKELNKLIGEIGEGDVRVKVGK